MITSWCKSNPVWVLDETAEAKDESVTFPSPALAEMRSSRIDSDLDSALSLAILRVQTTSNSSPANGTIFNPMTWKKMSIIYREINLHIRMF